MSVYIVLAEVYQEKLTLYKQVVGEWRDILILFSVHCKCPSLILYQNLTSGNFLKFGANVKSTTQ